MLCKEIVRFKAGIYKITNLKNNKTYIGGSINIYNRYHTHKTKLKNQIHSSRHLQSSYNKYGADSFMFEVVEYVDILEKVVLREQYYLDTLKPEYNKRADATLNLGVKNSPEVRAKISKTLLEAYASGRKKGKCTNNIHLHLFDINGVFMAEYSSSKKCAEFLGVNRNLPLIVAKGGKKIISKGEYIVLLKSEAHTIPLYAKME